MTKKVREGLRWLAEYGRSWLEADGWETPEGIDADQQANSVEEMRAALKFVEEGGLDA